MRGPTRIVWANLTAFSLQYFKVLANAKHFSGYDVETGTDNLPGRIGGGAQYSRGSFNGHTSRQDMIETYWPQFRAAVQGAELGGTMWWVSRLISKFQGYFRD